MALDHGLLVPLLLRLEELEELLLAHRFSHWLSPSRPRGQPQPARIRSNGYQPMDRRSSW